MSLGRLLAYSRRETLEILRDPVRLAFAFVGSLILMLAFGFGITTDVEDIRFATLDPDDTPESRAYLAEFEGSQTFLRQRPLDGQPEMERRMRANDISLAIEIPPQFGRDLERDAGPEVSAVVDGANPFRAETIKQYVGRRELGSSSTEARAHPAGSRPPPPSARIQSRYRYNPSFESIYAIVPSIPPILLILIPAILMAVSVVREKELGSIINFYVTPTNRLEFLLGKQLPYIAIGMLNYFILMFMAIVVFRVPLKGSGLTLTLCALLYVTATTGIGLLVSTFTPSQVAAVFVTAILTILPTTQFSGLLQPVSTLEGRARVVGSLWPTTYYMHASVGAFTKGLGPRLLAGDVLALAAFIPVLTILAAAALSARRRDHEAARQHLLARDQGAAQPAARHRSRALRHLRLHVRHLHPGEGDLVGGQ